MSHRCAIGILAGLLILCGPLNMQAAADCLVESRGGVRQGQLKTHLSAECTDSEREARSIDASNLMAALKRGQAIDLSGVVIHGDLVLDTLPISANPPKIDGVSIQRDSDMRVIAGRVSIVNSVVRGVIKHQSAQGLLLFIRPVTFSGTTFEQPVDLSRSVFAQPVTLSGAVFLREGYFVQGHFLAEVIGEKTAFGPHTRFHRSQFHGPVTFKQSGFSGLTEFLEVMFDRDANFSHTYFKSGTGFSGSQFKGLSDFSEAVFDGDAFFTFTRFDGDTYFRRATFRATADFDDAQFNAREDFSKVSFEKGPQFARAKRSTQGPQPLGIENPQVQYVITLSLLLFGAFLIAYLVRYR
jgi:uncharacterized protein YjbI with pentapeptide repeats